MRAAILALLLATKTASASAEIQLASNVSKVSIALEDETALTVWSQKSPDGDEDVFGSLIRLRTRSSEPPFPISVGPGDQHEPAVAAGPYGFFVVWTDRSIDPRGDIRGTRVSFDGDVGVREGLTICSAPADMDGMTPATQDEPIIVRIRDGFGVVWRDGRSVDVTSEVYFSRLADRGTVFEGSGVRVGGTDDLGVQILGAAVKPEVDLLAIAWSTESEVFLSRVDALTSHSDTTLLISKPYSDGVDRCDVAAGLDDDFLLLCSEPEYTGTGFLYAPTAYRLRITWDDLTEESSEILGAATDSSLFPAATFDGSRFVTGWVTPHEGGGGSYGSDVVIGSYGGDAPNAGISVIQGARLPRIAANKTWRTTAALRLGVGLVQIEEVSDSDPPSSVSPDERETGKRSVGCSVSATSKYQGFSVLDVGAFLFILVHARLRREGCGPAPRNDATRCVSPTRFEE